MKKKYFYLFFAFLTFSNVSFAQFSVNDFVTRWSGVYQPVNGTAVHIPVSSNYSYNYDVDWDNDGVFDDFGITDSITHVYSSGSSQLIVRIRGTFPAIVFGNSLVKREFLGVVRWGSIPFKDFTSAFEDCSNADFCAFDTPTLDTTVNVSFEKAFKGTLWFSCFSGGTNISTWDMSPVTNMSGMFQNALFVSPGVSIGSWDVSSVTDMSDMFRGTTDFTQVNLSGWDVSNVRSMKGMFAYSDFYGNISTWNVSAVKNMESILEGCVAFDQNLGNWPIDSVSNMIDALDRTNLSIANYDSTLIGWSNRTRQNNVQLGVEQLEYCNSISARNILLTNGWIMSGDTTNCITSTRNVDLTEFNVYPNPASGILHIEGLRSESVVEVYKTSGKLTLRKALQDGGVDLSSLPVGLYFIKIAGSVQKLIIE